MTSCAACGKNPRATLYCRRGDCPGLAGARAAAVVTTLPPPKIDVTHSTAGSDQTVDVVVSREGTGTARSYRGVAPSVGAAVKEVIEKIFADPGSREYHG